MTFIFQEDGSNFRIVFSIAMFRTPENCQVELLQTHLDLQKKPVDANSSKEASARELEVRSLFFVKKKGILNFKLERCLILYQPP